MAKQSSVNLDITNNVDGFDVSGGTTKRKLTSTGGDVTLVSGGANTYRYPVVGSCTLANASLTITDQTANRSIDETYVNPSDTQSILVMANLLFDTTGGGRSISVQAKGDTNSPPTTPLSGEVGVTDTTNDVIYALQICFVVPAGSTQRYRLERVLTAGVATLQSWFEYTF